MRIPCHRHVETVSYMGVRFAHIAFSHVELVGHGIKTASPGPIPLAPIKSSAATPMRINGAAPATRRARSSPARLMSALAHSAHRTRV
jgi:hypothetical protein